MPTSFNNLFPQIAAFENLHAAWEAARRGKRRRPDVARFERLLEPNLLRLERQLLDGSYRPGRYRSFYIREPKRRKISAAPFRDRAVHHALVRVIGPIFEARFSNASYACRAGKGTHRAADHAQRLLRHHRYVLKADSLFVRRLRRQQRAYRAGKLSAERLRASLQGWIAHARHADTHRLRARLLWAHPFTAGHST